MRSASDFGDSDIARHYPIFAGPESNRAAIGAALCCQQGEVRRAP